MVDGRAVRIVGDEELGRIVRARHSEELRVVGVERVVLDRVLPSGAAVHDQAEDVERIGPFGGERDPASPRRLRHHLALHPGALPVILDADRPQVLRPADVLQRIVERRDLAEVVEVAAGEGHAGGIGARPGQPARLDHLRERKAGIDLDAGS